MHLLDLIQPGLAIPEVKKELMKNKARRVIHNIQYGDAHRIVVGAVPEPRHLFCRERSMLNRKGAAVLPGRRRANINAA